MILSINDKMQFSYTYNYRLVNKTDMTNIYPEKLKDYNIYGRPL